MSEYTVISKILGLTPVNVVQADDEIKMKFEDGSEAFWYHSQDCCENVVVDDVTGDWADLYGHPLLVAEERTSDNFDGPVRGYLDDSNTWTFYTFRNVGGSVDVRWHGSSNGYYSESVDFSFTPPKP